MTYLSTLAKHTQAVNVVRWCPKGKQYQYIEIFSPVKCTLNFAFVSSTLR